MQHRWDIFCKVIDNFGDIGVCWRLARQLTQEHRQAVRLWVDDLISFARIAPDLDPHHQRQVVQGVDIYQWHPAFAEVEPADVVIEAFACDLPEAYVTAMSQQTKPPVWINLEYLSAEPWVMQFHGLPSPHPRFSLTKTCFFPGFAPGTGGLLREKGLVVQRNAFDAAAEQAFLQRKKLPARKSGEIRISLFCYADAPVEKLIQVLTLSSIPILLIVPQGEATESIAAFLKNEISQSESQFSQGALTVQIIPFMEQTDYDQLLWSCDVNFVRGEDSFVRAQWAINPFVWNIYPQTDDAHWKKLDAFLDLYTINMPLEMAVAVRDMWHSWNGKYEMNQHIWMNFLRFHQSMQRHNKNWVSQLFKQDDLATSLVQFVGNRL